MKKITNTRKTFILILVFSGFLLIFDLFLLLVGCMMDIFSTILMIMVPLIIPMAQEFGIKQLELAVFFMVNLAIGYNTPPVGLNLFICQGYTGSACIKIIYLSPALSFHQPFSAYHYHLLSLAEPVFTGNNGVVSIQKLSFLESSGQLSSKSF